MNEKAQNNYPIIHFKESRLTMENGSNGPGYVQAAATDKLLL